MSRALAVGWLACVLGLCAVSAGCDGGGQTQPTPLSVAAISPNAGTMLGGTRVEISGAGFKPGATVLFAGVPAVVTVVTATSITATAPAHAHGGVIVVVTNRDGQSATLLSPYTFEIDPAFAISGVVTEMTDEGEVPVDGVRIADRATGNAAFTDARGAYRLGDMRRSNFVLAITKPGYGDVTKSVTASSDMQLDLRVARVPSFVLSGMVYESTPNGRLPLDGVVLYCDGCGSPTGHTFVTTDSNGLYSFAWTLNGKNWIQFISKDGYRYAGLIEPFGIPVTVNGDTRFDLELVKR